MKRHNIFTAIFLSLCVNFTSVVFAQDWEKSDNETFSASLVECDNSGADFKFADGEVKRMDLEELSEKSRRRAILEGYKAKFQDAMKSLENELKNATGGVEANERHLQRLNDIGFYTSELIRPVAEKLEAGGGFPSNADYWTRVHSGISFYAYAWLNELAQGDKVLKRGERRRPMLNDIVKNVKNFNEFYEDIFKGRNYFQRRLGRQFPVRFTPKEYVKDYQPYHYYAYLPQGYDGRRKMPVLFFLCGSGEFGTSLDSVLATELPLLLEERKDFPFIVISTQNNDRVTLPPYLNEIYNDVKERFKIDEERVVVTGLSSGGTGAWRWALSDPEKIAGIAAVSAVMPLYEIRQLKEMPVWIFCNEHDNVWIQELCIANMAKLNPNFKHTIYKGAKGHNAWSKAYRTKGLEQWMLNLRANKKGDNGSNPLNEFEFEDSLSAPALKTVPAEKYITYDCDENNLTGETKREFEQAIPSYGSAHDVCLAYLMVPLFNYQHFQLGQSVSAPGIKFLAADKPSVHTFGIPLKNVSDFKILPPLKISDEPAFKCYSAMYLSESADPGEALERLREKAKKAGHNLTGRDRIVYLQMLFSDRNVYELQVGIR